MITTTITSFFTEDGVPKEGLTPAITIRDSSTSIIIVSSTCSEIGGGTYKYDFIFDINKSYSVVIDGGNVLSDAERYMFTSVPDITNRVIQGAIM